MTVVSYTIILALLLLSLATMAYLYSFQAKKQKLLLAAVGVTGASGLVLGAAVYFTWSAGSGTGSSAILLAFILAWMTVFGYFKFGMKNSGLLTLPVAILVLLGEVFSSTGAALPVDESLTSYRNIHILAAILGECMAIGAFATSLTYLWQHRNLKKKNMPLVSSEVPALDKLSSILDLSLWLGLGFLTVALISGAYFYLHSLTKEGFAAKIVWAICVWLWYLIILVLRHVLRKSPILTARLSLVGFFILATSLFGILFTT